jgi:predicted small lipoprotein YifL
MFKIYLMMICTIAFLAGCSEQKGPERPPDALFSDVAKKPPLTKHATVDYLVANDRAMAEWVEYMARSCDRHGCI